MVCEQLKVMLSTLDKLGLGKPGRIDGVFYRHEPFHSLTPAQRIYEQSCCSVLEPSCVLCKLATRLTLLGLPEPCACGEPTFSLGTTQKYQSEQINKSTRQGDLGSGRTPVFGFHLDQSYGHAQRPALLRSGLRSRSQPMNPGCLPQPRLAQRTVLIQYRAISPRQRGRYRSSILIGDCILNKMPHHLRGGKTGERAWRCNVVGYTPGGKGWVFYVPTHNVFFESSMASFPYSVKIDINPPAPSKQLITSSKSLNKLLNTDSGADECPGLLQLDDDPTATSKLKSTPVKSVNDLLNNEDQSPMICKSQLEFGNNLAEQTIAGTMIVLCDAKMVKSG
ncbi:uncharacterized protein VP01_378g5 [Puccinia sorghi]|uniref:Retroviral polymerase SH3-like domain-containing protein n=1 Tax=Puccinia sorghi TaxID=27349 RepID=A0A0L6UUD9_9BASI|nr:uncharacterized protein VP01_378g5 [Puccinia sorghi]